MKHSSIESAKKSLLSLSSVLSDASLSRSSVLSDASLSLYSNSKKQKKMCLGFVKWWVLSIPFKEKGGET